MPALRRISSTTLQQLKTLLADNTLPVNQLTASYKDYTVSNEAQSTKTPLTFRWSRGDHTEPLYFGFYTWNTAESKKYPDTFLALGTSADFRIVGFPLYLLPQDQEFVYLSFKLGNNEGGKNRWFGRGRSAKELRSVAQTEQLALDIRRALQEVFPTPLFTHPTLSGEWLALARLPLADLKGQTDPVQRTALKTLIFENLLQAFVIAEKLRDESLKAAGMQTQAPISEVNSTIPTPMITPLNQILYGPPGTGKTYHTKVRAVGIIEEMTDEEVADTYDREKVNSLFEDYRKTGQIEFVTFHQASGYEDFVEGIKPALLNADADETEATEKLGYVLANGIFKVLSERGIYASYLQKQHRLAEEANVPQIEQPDFDSAFENFTNHLRERLANEPQGSVIFQSKHKTKLVLQSINEKGTAYFRYENGFSDNLPQVTRNGLRKIDADNPLVAQSDLTNADFIVSHGRDRTVYWAAFREFLAFRAQEEQLPPQQRAQLDSKDALERVTADPKIASEIIQNLKLRDFVREDYLNSPRFVLIIDEINRGNVANIFGELITLLEDDKRAGRPEAMTVKLPYSKEDFTVSENLYLLGTMNTADRSVEALDTALRRRFSFTEMQPDAQVIRAKVGHDGVIGEGDDAVDVACILEALNSRLEQLLNRDHCLGHALLLRVQHLDDLRTAFQRNILPLLQEYFFGDWGKIGLVLGPDFVEVVDAKTPGRYALAKFGRYDAANLRDKPVYRLADLSKLGAQAFRNIYATA